MTAMGTIADLSPEERAKEIAWSKEVAPVSADWWRQKNVQSVEQHAVAAQQMAAAQDRDVAWLRERETINAAREDLRLLLECATAIFVDQTSSLDLPAKLEDRAKRAVTLAKLLVAECKQ